MESGELDERVTFLLGKVDKLLSFRYCYLQRFAISKALAGKTSANVIHEKPRSIFSSPMSKSFLCILVAVKSLSVFPKTSSAMRL